LVGKSACGWSVAGRVATVTLNRPERKNPLTFESYRELTDTFHRLRHLEEIKVIVLTGDGAFCAGGDLRGFSRLSQEESVAHIRDVVYGRVQRMVRALADCPVPTIAAVDGGAVGLGMDLALACDIRLAAAGAYFRAAGINNGLTASELGLSYLLPKAIGTSRAFEAMLTGRDIDAEEAERIGLVSRTVPDDDLLDTCYEMAERIASFSRPGTELTKRTLWSGLEAGSLEGHMQAEGLGQLYVRLLTANFEEAVAARADKRAPAFTDDK